jgi:hypothetical protein
MQEGLAVDCAAFPWWSLSAAFEAHVLNFLNVSKLLTLCVRLVNNNPSVADR